MAENITDIKPSDITKPKKLAKKALGLLEAGFGGVLQETISSVLSGFIPSQIPDELAKTGEALGLMVIGGATKNEHLKNLVGGAVAGSAKDLAKMILSKLNINLTNLRLGAVGVPTALPSPAVAGVGEEDLEGY